MPSPPIPRARRRAGVDARPARLAVRAGRWVRGGAAAAGNNVLTALVQIWANKGRALLTTLGIVIAVTSIITVVAFVEGFGNHVQKMLRGYGTRYMSVHPWVPGDRHGMHDARLTLDDMMAVRFECSLVHRISPFVFTENAAVQHGQNAGQRDVDGGCLRIRRCAERRRRGRKDLRRRRKLRVRFDADDDFEAHGRKIIRTRAACAGASRSPAESDVRRRAAALRRNDFPAIAARSAEVFHRR